MAKAKTKNSVAKATNTKTTKAKKVPGKTILSAPESVYKPSIYLDDKQIPKNIGKVGDKVQLTVTGKIVSSSERVDKSGKSKSVSIEIDRIK